MSRQRNFSFVKPLLVLCNIFGLLPPHEFGEFESPVSLKFKLYSFSHILGVVAISAYTFYGREKYVYPDLHITVHITDKLANLLLSVFSVISRILLVFCHNDTLKKYLNTAFNLSKQHYVRCFTKASFWVQFVIFNIYMTVILSFDAYVWNTTLGFHIFRFYLGRSFMYYICNLIVFFMFESAVLIKHLFLSLNKLLEANCTWKNCCDLRKIRKDYGLVCDLVDAFNDIFGVPFLMIIVFIIAFIINLTNLLLVYALAAKDLQGAHYEGDLISLCAMWMITLLIFVSLLAHSCATAICQSQKITVICLTCLNEIPTIPRSPQMKMLKDEILLLIQQTTCRQPKFSAAGFFPVDFTLIGFILGSVTSYVIISIQFMQV